MNVHSFVLQNDAVLHSDVPAEVKENSFIETEEFGWSTARFAQRLLWDLLQLPNCRDARLLLPVSRDGARTGGDFRVLRILVYDKPVPTSAAASKNAERTTVYARVHCGKNDALRNAPVQRGKSRRYGSPTVVVSE